MHRSWASRRKVNLEELGEDVLDGFSIVLYLSVGDEYRCPLMDKNVAEVVVVVDLFDQSLREAGVDLDLVDDRCPFSEQVHESGVGILT